MKFQTSGDIKVTAEVLCKSRSDAEFLLRIGVEDHGFGMTEEEQRNVFEVFDGIGHFRNRDRNPYNNGIGLAICDQICKSLGGNITVKSQPGMGTTFKFTMKVLNDQASSNRQILAIESTAVRLHQIRLSSGKEKNIETTSNVVSSIKQKQSEWGDFDDQKLLEAINLKEVEFNGQMFDLNGDRTQPTPGPENVNTSSRPTNEKLLRFLRVLKHHELLKNVKSEG